MLKQVNRRLRDRAVVTAAILSLCGYDAACAADADSMGGTNRYDHSTVSPIKHVIVIMPRGEHVDNLLSKGIITVEGTPGPNYAKAAQFSAIDSHFYSINPDHKAPYDHTNKPQPPGTSYAFQACYSDYKKAATDGPGCLTDVTIAATADYGLLPADLPILTRGATGVPPGSPIRASRTTTICRAARIRW
jgi:phospholipase C